MRKRGYCHRRVSVTRRYCIEADKDTIKLYLGLVAPPLWLSSAAYDCEIRTGKGACHSGRLQIYCVKTLNNGSARE